MNQDDKVRLGYQSAMGLIAYEGQIIWRAFTALIAANTGLAVIAGAGIKVFPNFLFATRILSVAGIIVCLAWILTLRRQFRYYKYWYAWVRHFEVKFLSPEVKMSTVGKAYGEGGSIESDENTPVLERFPFFARLARVEWLMIIVVVVYILIYILILWAGCNAAQNVGS